MIDIKRQEEAFDNIYLKLENKQISQITICLNSGRKAVIKEDRIQGKTPYYGATGIIDYVKGYTFDEEIVLLAEDGENIVSRNADLVYLVKGKSWVNNHAHVLKMKNGNNSYLKYKLSSLNYLKYNTGTAQPKINLKTLNNIKVNIHIDFLQNKIANFLTSLDELIQKQEEYIEELKVQKKGYSEKIFNQKLRFKGFEENWTYKKIKDIFIITRGNVLSKEDLNNNGKYPVYSSQTSNRGLMGYYDEYLFENAITWTTDGANAGEVNMRRGKFYCTNVCGVLLSDSGYANQFIAEKLNLITHKHVSYVGNPKLMNNVMGDISIEIPEVDQQEKIGDFLFALDDKIELQEQKLEQLKQKKKYYLNKIFQ